MILTVTPNSALDRVFIIETWTPGRPLRIDHAVTAAGGKGIDVAVSLSCQGIPSRALCFLAGETGRRLEQLLVDYGIELLPVWVGGETRTAHVIVERQQERHTHLIAGSMRIEPDDLDTFLDILRRKLSEASWMVCGGSLPPALDSRFFAQIVELAHEKRVPSLVDTSSLPLEPVLAAAPAVVKLNREELNVAFGSPLSDQEEIIGAGLDLIDRFSLKSLVITCGENGLYAFTGNAVYFAQAPAQKVVNAAGAGDAASGALVHNLALGRSWPEAVRRAAAVSAATVLTEATAECRMADISRILPQTTVSRIL
ncbi:MAG: 1-phosphofructokinase family hexose kinase [Candidatus Promineifilaceae bacterium]